MSGLLVGFLDLANRAHRLGIIAREQGRPDVADAAAVLSMHCGSAMRLVSCPPCVPQARELATSETLADLMLRRNGAVRS